MNVLISGGTGLIGTALINLLRNSGHEVRILTRDKVKTKDSKYIYWNPANKQLDGDKLKGTDAIIHLAGAGIADHRWTKSRKQVIVESRVQSAELLINTIKEYSIPVKQFISASGTGYYGSNLSSQEYDENAKPGDDFLAHCCVEWEKSVQEANDAGIKVTILRTGVVLSKNGGALPKLKMPVKFFVGSSLGSGRQYLPWIHIEDLCNAYKHCLENQAEGVYNIAAPNAETNKQFVRTTAKVLNRPILLPAVPGFLLKLFLGEMANTVLFGQNVSVEKIKATGFNFKFNKLESALSDLLNG